MSSSKVIYVNDDDMLGGIFNNETKPLVSAPEHKPTNTPMTTSQQVSVEQTGGESTMTQLQGTHMKPVAPLRVPQPSMVPQQPSMVPQQPPMVPQQPPMVPQNQPVITNSHQLPVMTGGVKNENGDENEDGDDSSESSSDAGSDDDDSNKKLISNTPLSNNETPDGIDIDNDNDKDSCSDTSSICTEQLLTFDPMYIKLTKFLYTSEPDGKSGRNITQVLEGIEKQMERLATALANSTLMSASSVEETIQDEKNE